jgi:hypothetical protein
MAAIDQVPLRSGAGRTVRTAAPAMPAAVAAISAVPVRVPMTLPCRSTVATAGSLLLHATAVRSSRLAPVSRTSACQDVDSPWRMVVDPGTIVTEATGPRTAMTADPWTPSQVAVIVAEPGPTASA